MARRLVLVLGGARSGKSAYVEDRARASGQSVLFVATAQPFDEEMRRRIERHRAERPPDWTTLETPLRVAGEVSRALAAGRHDTVVLDCLTLLASNVMLALPDSAPEQAVYDAVLAEVERLLEVASTSAATWLIVSNEVGMGVVPPTRHGRYFRDALGRANQRVASVADEVVLMVAGLPWHLKS